MKKQRHEPLPHFDTYTVDFDSDDRPQCFHLSWKDVEVATIRLAYDSNGYLSKAIRQGTKEQRLVSLKELANLPFFTAYIHRINLIDLIKEITNIENVESIDLIDAITSLGTLNLINTINLIKSISSIDSITTLGTINEIKNIVMNPLIEELIANQNFRTLTLAEWESSNATVYTDTLNGKVFPYVRLSGNLAYVRHLLPPIIPNGKLIVNFNTRTSLSHGTSEVKFTYVDGDTEVVNYDLANANAWYIKSITLTKTVALWFVQLTNTYSAQTINDDFANLLFWKNV